MKRQEKHYAICWKRGKITARPYHFSRKDGTMIPRYKKQKSMRRRDAENKELCKSRKSGTGLWTESEAFQPDPWRNALDEDEQCPDPDSHWSVRAWPEWDRGDRRILPHRMHGNLKTAGTPWGAEYVVWPYDAEQCEGYRGRSVPQSGNGGRKHIRAVRIFRRTDRVPCPGYRSGTFPRRDPALKGVCNHAKR